MNTQQKYRTLVERLYQRTSEGKLDWKIDAVLDEIDLQFSGKMISMGPRDNEDGVPVMALRIVTGDGITDRFDDEDISGVAPSVGEFKSYYQLMGAIMAMAKRNASGADRILDDLLNDLAS